MEPTAERSDVSPWAPLWVCELGLVPYEQAASLQERLRSMRQAERIPDTLLLLQHPPVYTRGRRSSEKELLLREDFYASKGIKVVCTDRGGRVTYHGPGQLVGYPIMRLPDVIGHLRTMEQAIVDALAVEGIQARSRAIEGPDFTGVWVQERKIASIGVHFQRGVSTHGFALNVTNDLTPFSWVVPCGLSGVQMTSVAAELERNGQDRGRASLRSLSEAIIASFCRQHRREPVVISETELELTLQGTPQQAPEYALHGSEQVALSRSAASEPHARALAEQQVSAAA